MKHGTYIRGWRYDWAEAKKKCDRLIAAGREIAASFCADPGVTSCIVCGEHHWNEFEVYLCSRCGAENDTKNKTAGPAEKPEMVRPKLHDGMRVRFVSHDMTGIDGKPKKRLGMWMAGHVAPGTLGTIRKHDDPENILTGWRIDFDGITPKLGYIFGMFGPFLDDDFEEVVE